MATPRQLRRSSSSKIIGGVCGGLAEYFGLDVTLVRILWIALTILSAGFTGILLYLLAWIIMPAPLATGMPTPAPEAQTGALVGLVLVGAGVVLLMFFTLPWHFFRPWHYHYWFWPFFPMRFLLPSALLILGIIFIVVGLSNRQTTVHDHETQPPTETAESHQEQQGEASAVRRLYRSMRDKKIAGICGGLGEYLQVDSTVIRLLWILLIVLFGTGILLYLILWIVTPREPFPLSPVTPSP
jgi:phage shock protein C